MSKVRCEPFVAARRACKRHLSFCPQPPPRSLGPEAVLLLVPAIGHVSGLYAIAMVSLELHLWVSSPQTSRWFLRFEAEAAGSILSTIAGGISRRSPG